MIKTPKLTEYFKRIDTMKGELKAQTSILFKW